MNNNFFEGNERNEKMSNESVMVNEVMSGESNEEKDECKDNYTTAIEKLEAELKDLRENINTLFADSKDKESNMEEYVDMKIKEKELQMEISKKQSSKYCAKRRQEINKLKKDLKKHKKKILDNVIKSKGLDLEKLIKAAENM